MRAYRILLLLTLCVAMSLSVTSVAIAIDTDGDGLLDLMDVPRFNPNGTEQGYDGGRRIEQPAVAFPERKSDHELRER